VLRGLTPDALRRCAAARPRPGGDPRGKTTIAHHATADAQDIALWLGVPVAVTGPLCADLEAAGLLTAALEH